MDLQAVPKDPWPEVTYEDDVMGHFNGNTGPASAQTCSLCGRSTSSDIKEPTDKPLRWVGRLEVAFAGVYGGKYLHGGLSAHALAIRESRNRLQMRSLARRVLSVPISFILCRKGPADCCKVEIAQHASKSPVMVGTKDNGEMSDTADKTNGLSCVCGHVGCYGRWQADVSGIVLQQTRATTKLMCQPDQG